MVPISVLEALPPEVPPFPPIAVWARLSVPLVAPPTASFTPPLLIRLTDAPLAPKLTGGPPPFPPIAVPDTVTAPPLVEIPKSAGPSPPLESVAEPPLPPVFPFPPLPPVAIPVIVTC